MTRFSEGLLEYEALRALIGRYVASPGGQAELERVAPSADQPAIERELADTAEAIAYEQAAAETQTTQRGAAVSLRFDSLPDAAPLVELLRVPGSVLEGLEIRDMISVLERASQVRATLASAQGRFSRLGGIAAAIGEFRPLLRDLAGRIEADGTVADHASVLLGRIRRDLERQQRLIHQSLERFLKAHRDDGIVQEEFIAIRNDRFVLPIVAGQKKKVAGIVHAASGTGQTLFIEPLESVELNNDLVRLRQDEEREVRRILAEMTDRLRAVSGDVAASVAVLGRLDFLFAKARFASDFGGVIPRFTARLHLGNARHPLLADVLRRQRKALTPLNLTLEGGVRTLVISGPNTGGKTVALKTVGLGALMAQSGIPVPAEEAEFPLFEEVLADIGDNQSIEQSLSTFSAHIARIREMFGALGARSLVLLDELGRATDPEEGGALGVAIVEHARGVGAYTLASTHLVAPKIYGSSTEGVLNASMSFDEETLAPTYRLRTGMPGASAGLKIAARLGLPPALIEDARSRQSSEHRDLARLLELLERRIDSLAKAESSVAEARAALEAEKIELARLWEKRESSKIREIERRTDELIKAFESRARVTLDQIAAGAEQKKATQQGERRVAQVRRELREDVTAAISVTRKQEGPEAPPVQVREGARVRLRGVREPARVRRLLSGGNIEVEAGFLKLQVPLEDVIEVLPDTPDAAKLPKGVTLTAGPRFDTLSREINVIGKRAEEAAAEVDKFLDNAALASVMRIRIVHGHGMGILKRTIAELLTSHPLVGKFYAASPQEGGAGATIVEMRDAD